MKSGKNKNLFPSILFLDGPNYQVEKLKKLGFDK